MPALVTELVNAAIDTSVSPGDLLRRALVVTKRLAVPELVEWISKELDGYHSGDVPDYRRVRGTLMAENPMHGYIPLFAPPDIDELLSDYEIRQSVPELIQVALSTTGIYSHLPRNVEHSLMQMMRESNGIAMRPVLAFSIVQVQGVIEKARSRVLEWALDLESKGVHGDGMTFSQEEKQIVQQHYHFRDVSGSQIQIGSNGSNQTQTHTGGDMAALSALIELLCDAIQQGSVGGEARDELQAELATLQAQAASPKPKWAVIKATAGSIKAVLENAAGSGLASQVLPYLSALL